MLALEDYLFQFTVSLLSHAVLVVYLFVIMRAFPTTMWPATVRSPVPSC